VSVNAENGVAYLRGQVPDQEWVDRLGEATREVDGVKGVKNLLHTPGTPAPNV
jgi:osmotically-inducible protein OsmY